MAVCICRFRFEGIMSKGLGDVRGGGWLFSIVRIYLGIRGVMFF